MRTTPEARRIMVSALILILITAALDLAGVVEVPTPVSALMTLTSLGIGTVMVLGRHRLKSPPPGNERPEPGEEEENREGEKQQ